MKLVLMVIGGIIGALLFANIVAATFIWPPEPAGKATSNKATSNTATSNIVTSNSATQQGQDPWMAGEKYIAPHRDQTRKNALATLDQPWASYCTPDGHKRLIDTINYYYGQRHSQAWSYGKTYGEAARDYSIKTWTTADDSRIERLIGETYGRGYFTLSQLQAPARDALGKQVQGVRVSAKPCAG